MKYSFSTIITLMMHAILTVSVASVKQTKINPSLSGIIQKDTTLNEGTYLVDKNLKIMPGAILTINSGVSLLFARHTSIRIEGGIIINGTGRNPVRITSVSPREDELGEGLIISGYSQNNAILQHILFSHLNQAVKLENGWARKQISITNCEFSYCNSSFGIITLGRKDPFDEHFENSQIEFSNNSIHNCHSGLSIADALSSGTKISIQRNVFSGNRIFGNDYVEVTSAPLFIAFNDQNFSQNLLINENSFSYNYLVNPETDSILLPRNIAIIGQGKELTLENTYFDSQIIDSIQLSLFHFLQDAGSPYLNLKGTLTIIPDSAPFGLLKSDKQTETDRQVFKLTFTKPVLADSIIYPFGSTIISTSENSVQFSVEDSMIKEQIIYLKNIMSKLYTKIENIELATGYSFIENTTKETSSGSQGFSNDSLSIYSREIERVIKRLDAFENAAIGQTRKDFRKHLEAGAFFGLSSYFGDLRPPRTAFNWNYYNNAIGLSFKYNFHPKMGIEAGYLFGSLEAEDYYERGYNFKSLINDAHVTFQWYLTPNVNSRIYPVIPTLGFGLSGFTFNPYSTINQQKIYLSNLKTNGYNYKLKSIGIPIIISLKKYFSDNVSITLYGNYTYTFNNNLDDVSGNFLPKDSSLASIISNGTKGSGSGKRGYKSTGDSYFFIGFILSTRIDKNTFIRRKVVPESN